MPPLVASHCLLPAVRTIPGEGDLSQILVETMTKCSPPGLTIQDEGVEEVASLEFGSLGATDSRE